MTREEEIATAKALNSLDALAEIWAQEIDLHSWLSGFTSDDASREKLEAIARECFIEGAYRRHLDQKSVIQEFVGRAYEDAARIADAWRNADYSGDANETAENIAAAIRARAKEVSHADSA